jgi:uncharacterized protein YndB with AHSA1/START domain
MHEKTEAMKIVPQGQQEIRVERVFEASRERVWSALTDPKLVVQWWGGEKAVTIERMDVVKGGRYRFVEDGLGYEGRYREVTPPERLVCTFEWDGMPGHVIVHTMTLEELPGRRTRLVTMWLHHTEAERDGVLGSGVESGMAESYAALDRLLARLEGAGR